jgi:S-DNA-T family DNA segregation ATPase FtsK/SpoIIIE
MGENTYKKSKGKPEKTEKEDKVKSEGFKFNLNFLKDPKFHNISGFFIMLASFCLTFAFISYLFSGKYDQSVVESIFNTKIKESGQEVQNWLGIIGAFVSYFFIFRWFGIAAFLFIPIFFIVGYRIVFKTELISISRTIILSAFFIFLISLSLGYIVLMTGGETTLGYLSGGIGYEMASIINAFIGWGTPFLILFCLIAFSIYFFNITNFASTPKLDEIIPEQNDNKEKDTTLPNLKKNNKELILQTESAKEELPEEWSLKVLDEKVKETVKIEPKEEVKKIIVKDFIPEVIKSNGKNDFDLMIEKIEEEKIVSDKKIENYDPTLDLSTYKYPPLDLLTEYEPSKVQVTKEELEANKDKIVETLSHYNISIASIKATIGPTVTLYEIVPDAGIRISKIKSLEDDIALSLAALGIRIIAPIPGKGTIGIEVPNKNKETVSIRSVIATEKFIKSNYDLPVVLGKTISNEIFVIDLAKLPHLLMAGATGQGKSVGLNVLLTSLIYRKHPSQLKFVLVDPKKVELSLFNKIERHFLAKLPDSEEAIITDTKKVVHTLNSLCIEMDTRYDLLKDANCRNLKEYNAKFVERKLNPENGHRFMPYIVLVIDELADLMMTAGKEVETPIARLAQLARAIGIHLVVATQRPSVNVITGTIKANFPARLSFKVASKIDSRTILDAGGADQLVGQGDMLYSHGSELIRLQCAFVDTPEVERVCEYIGSQRGYETAYMLPEYIDEEGEGGGTDFNFSERDALFEEAARLIVTHQQGSTSLLQRRLKLGYNRAGRLIDQLESAGIVGPFEGSKAREVLIKDELGLEQKLSELDSNKTNH